MAPTQRESAPHRRKRGGMNRQTKKETIQIVDQTMPHTVRLARGTEPVPVGTDPAEIHAQMATARRLLLESEYLAEDELTNLPEVDAIDLARQRHRAKYAGW